MALLVAANIVRAGLDVVGVEPTATTGDTFQNTGREFVEIKNGTVGSINVTLDITGQVDGIAPTDPVVAVGAGVTKAIGPFPSSYNDADGRVKVTCSVVTDVTIKVLKLPEA